MPARTRRPQDYTGRQADELAAKRDQEKADRAEELSMITQAEVDHAALDEVIDLTEKPAPAVATSAEIVTRSPKRKVRVNTDLENTTFGHGNHYNLKVGQQYMLPTDFADHLEKLGFVWH